MPPAAPDRPHVASEHLVGEHIGSFDNATAKEFCSNGASIMEPAHVRPPKYHFFDHFLDVPMFVNSFRMD